MNGLFQARVMLIILATWLPACQSLPGKNDPVAQLYLVESSPSETELDFPEIPNATEEWMDMISRAKESIDIAHVYISRPPHTAMDRIMQAFESAARRGVKIRFMIDEFFIKKHPQETGKHIEEVRTWPNTQVKICVRWSVRKALHHAKYFIVDGKDAFLGSHNLDWRAMEHIAELGFRIKSPPLLTSLKAIYEADWQLAEQVGAPQHFALEDFPSAAWREDDGSVQRVSVRFSPEPLEYSDRLWEWAAILKLIAEAQHSIRLSSMNYADLFLYEDKRPWKDLQLALAAAVKRGVKVQVMFDNKNYDKKLVELRAAGIEVSLVKIAEHSSGPIKHARLIHAKYLTIDERIAWLGTSNFEPSYFYASRNIGLLLESPKFAQQISRFFDRYWNSPYAYRVRN